MRKEASPALSAGPTSPTRARENAVPENDQGIIADLAAVRLAQPDRQHDEGIGRADQKAVIS